MFAMRSVLTVAGVAVVLLLAGSSCYSVDRTQYVYVTEFGRLMRIHDGEIDAGLHFKWPWPIQSVQRLDHRLQVFDLPEAELLTNDSKGKTIDKTLSLSAYVCWRIAGAEGVDRFIRAVGTPDRAESILGQRITSRLGAEIGKMELDELISVAPDKQVEERMEKLSRRLLGESKEHELDAGANHNLIEIARSNYGIEIVDVRLRRFNYPAQVRDAIFERIRSERNKKVADYQSEGARLAENIRSQAEYEARSLLADARATEQRLKGEADAEADRIRNEAQRKDVAFYAFLKKLGEYQRILGDNKTVLLLSSHRDLFDVLFQPPKPDGSAPTLKPGAAANSGKPPGKNGGQ
jgi:modulator of FtsH protease HflC